MNKSESIKELVAAVIEVMKEVKGIDKNMTIGSGVNAYKGIADKDVKKVVGESMTKNGLAIFPIEINDIFQVDRWGQKDYVKQQVFTKVNVKYLLTHTSGEYIEISGLGHGVDSQDKAAGKATTYALKYALLYTFMIPTGTIDDADKEHSDEITVPPVKENHKSETSTPPAKNAKKELVKLIHGSDKYKSAIIAMTVGMKGKVYTIDELKSMYQIDPVTEECLLNDTKK